VSTIVRCSGIRDFTAYAGDQPIYEDGASCGWEGSPVCSRVAFSPMPALDPRVTEECLDGTCCHDLDRPCPECGGELEVVDVRADA
jgi:hypothetical protein